MHTWCRAVCDFRSRPLSFAHRILPAGLRSRFQLFTSSGGLPNHLDSLRLKAPLQPCVDEHADLLPTLEFSKSHFFSTTNAIKKVEPPALVTLSTGILRCRLSLSGIRKPRTLPINIGFYSNTVWFFLEVWWNDRHLHRHPNRCRLTPKALQNIVGEKLLAVRVGYILQQCKGQNIELDAAWLSRVVILTLMFFLWQLTKYVNICRTKVRCRWCKRKTAKKESWWQKRASPRLVYDSALSFETFTHVYVYAYYE